MSPDVALIAAAGVVLVGLYLVGLGIAGFVDPARASRFLLGFAGSAPAHYLELVLRLAAGASFLVHAPRMLFPGAFLVFGGLLVVTSLGLGLVPWRWHRRFAERTVPRALGHLPWIAAASIALGGFVLVAIVGGGARPG